MNAEEEKNSSKQQQLEEKKTCIVNLIVSFYFVKIEICVFDSKSQVNNMIN